jgi:hypothetical protein
MRVASPWHCLCYLFMMIATGCPVLQAARALPMLVLLLASLGTALSGGCGSSKSDCLGPGGPYQRGKAIEPNANASLVCCEGLYTYDRQVDNGAGACTEPVGVANFSCLEGSCGDGKCEAGEQGACGCEADCGP